MLGIGIQAEFVVVLTAAEHADLGVVGRADENRASRAVVIVMVAPWSAGWRWGPAIEAPDVGTVAAVVGVRGPGGA